MKKLFVALMLLSLVLALVACGGEKTPEVTTEAPVVTTVAPVASKYTVKFVDADQFGGTVIHEEQVGRGKSAHAPVDPYHDGYIFYGWDIEDFSSIMSDTVITAVYRPMDKYTVTFYDEDGTQLGESVVVNEGSPVEAPVEPAEIAGKIFKGWDKQIGKVDRNWPDFEQYAKLSIEELSATTINYKVTATYDEVPVVPYKKGISIEFTETVDANGKKAYEPVDAIFATTPATFVSSQEYYTKGKTAEDSILNNANFYVAWDGDYIYVYARVYDPTICSRGENYCLNGPTPDAKPYKAEEVLNPWRNDVLELYYCFESKASPLTRQAVKVDAYGYRHFASKTTPVEHPEMSVHFAEIEYKTAVSKEANTYYIIFKIPAKTEAGVAKTANDAVSFADQINDLRSDTDFYNTYCSTSKDNYATWAYFTLGAAE